MENKTQRGSSTLSTSSSRGPPELPILQGQVAEPSPKTANNSLYKIVNKTPGQAVNNVPGQTVKNVPGQTVKNVPGQGISRLPPRTSENPRQQPQRNSVLPTLPSKLSSTASSVYTVSETLKPPSVPSLTATSLSRVPFSSVLFSKRTFSGRGSTVSSSSASDTLDQSLSSTSSSFYGLGVESLAPLDSLYICPVSEDLTGLNGFTNYEIRDYEGLRVFYAAELAASCPMTFSRSLGESRPFSIKMFDTQGHAILTILRPLTCKLCFCGVDCLCHCWANETMVKTKDRGFGRVIQCMSFNRPIFEILDEKDVHLFDVLGPKWGYFSLSSLFNIHYFPICLPDSMTMVGKILKGYDGLTEDRITNKETLGVIFPPNCTPEDKACLVACGFMLYVTYLHKGGRTAHRLCRYTIIVLTAVALLTVAFTAIVITINNDWD